ncbi:hypothetical protein HK096_006505 [Nowakowskiella sp. JEL0078]|nr:hypothetical protein HK096_006505 [Nowakowskiella sp. JEL0078]
MSDNIAHALAGAGGGMISMALTYPLTTVSMRSAVEKKSNAKTGLTGQISALNKIIAEEGVLGLYSGLNSALFGIAFTQGIYYFFYEKLKAIFEESSQRSSMTVLESMTAGAIAGNN